MKLNLEWINNEMGNILDLLIYKKSPLSKPL